MPEGYLLVIEDSPTIQSVVETALAGAGHRVIAAADGEAGLARIRDAGEPPRLILLDGLTPGRDAADFCRRLAADAALARVPVVVMTSRGKSAELEARFAKAPNVVDTIGKPFSPRALAALVARLTGIGPDGARPETPATPGTRAAVAEALALSARPAGGEAADAGAVAEARAFAARGQALAGDLEAISMSQILELLAEQAHSGILRVVNTATSARIELYFRDGRVDFAAAVGVAEELLLGRFVVETGDLSADALTRVLAERARAKEARPLFGADLLARGLISAEALGRALGRQTSELGYETLRWQDGFFQFRRTTELPAVARDAGLQLNVDRMLLEGYRRVDEWRVIAREIADPDEVYVRNDAKIGGLPRGSLTRDELAVLDEIDGRQSVRQIVRKLRLGSFDVSRMFFRLRRARLIRPRVAPTAL